MQIAVLKSNMATMIRLARLRPRDFDHWLTPFESMTVMETGPLMERVVSQGEILRVYRLLDLSSIKGFVDQKIVTSTNSPCFWWSSTLLQLPIPYFLRCDHGGKKGGVFRLRLNIV